MVDKVAFRCVNEFGADLVAQSPDYSALAAPVGGYERQDELLGNVQALGEQPDAAVRYVGNPAVPRRVADAALDLADAANGVAPRASSIHPHRLAILQVWLRKPALP